jgi:V8-like Glu-specific endopeptidase
MIETVDPITFNRRTGVLRGTAFLISPCYMISNRHLVFGDETDNLVAAENSMKIWLGVGPGGGFDAFTLATPVAWGRRTLTQTNDWAIARLKTCVGGRFGWMEIQPETPFQLVGAWVATAGYPGDKPRDELWSHSRCRIRFPDRRVGLLTHDCATVAGMSGAPIYRRLADGTLRAVAMNVGDKNDSRRVMTIYGRNFANTAVDMAGVFADPQLRQMILDDIAAFGRDNPSSSPGPRAPGGSATGTGQ